MNNNFTEALSGGAEIRIRPVDQNDIERERRFIGKLSKQTRYLRFLGGVRELSEDLLNRFCDVDRVHDMAFIALAPDTAEESQIGVARYVADPDARTAEIAIVVADEWQDKGVDEKLLSHLIEYAAENDIQELYTFELAINSDMRSLTRKFGFESRTDPNDARLIVYRLPIASTPQYARAN